MTATSSNNSQELPESIRATALIYPAILAVYLFGSHSTGKAKPESDLDLAILLQFGQEKDFPLLEWAVSLEKALGRRVDPVILNRAGELLKYQVRRYGRLLYERDPRLRKQFEIRGRKSFEDFLYLHHRYLNRQLQRPD
jgi:predicted nucleotidyltransferase